MSEMKRDVDLGVLARAPKQPAASVPPKKRRWLALIVPLVLVAGFAAVLFSTLGDLLRGAVRVTVVRPQAVDGLGGTAAAPGSGELHRSGWIEPDPYPIFATALEPGVVRELLVLEGDAVEKDQPLAQLVDDAAKIALAQADAALAGATAAVQKAEVERDVALQQFDAALEVTEAAALAEADWVGRTAEVRLREAAAKQAHAKVRVAEEELALAKFLAENGGAGPRQVELAAANVDAEQAALAVLEAEAALAAAEAKGAQARRERANRELELRLDDRLRRDGAIASAAMAQADLAEARAAQEAAALALARTTVRAPAAGVVLQRLAAPGAMVGIESREAVCSLFDPASLRVRVDVEQSEVAKLAVGQRAQVKAPTRPDRAYAGEVIRVVRLANVEKVTLQVHVRLADPDAALRPEMLVEVRFLAGAAAREPKEPGGGGPGEPRPAGDGSSVAIPARVVVERDGTSAVWVIDAISGHAALRAIDVASRDGDRVLVRRGLNVSDKVIDEGREQLREGARVEIATESAPASAPEGR